MKKSLLILGLIAITNSAQAGLWEDSKSLAAEAWESTKEASLDLKDSASQKWNEVKKEMGSSESEEESGQLSDIKKLGDKETYIKAWEGIKESAMNPSEPNVDENGIPKQ
ncbi:hypothetical protein [Thiomicrorhabdus sp. Milos-T2]|uniref:hypothetical protein n=1 Tax=Thiomicrorhabdus sp. Milos-T2 TaxID=90814 RepID=UPI0004944991|nr:hypothetical protein [Thiomicrorhabdus sp. Milos-T2]